MLRPHPTKVVFRTWGPSRATRTITQAERATWGTQRKSPEPGSDAGAQWSDQSGSSAAKRGNVLTAEGVAFVKGSKGEPTQQQTTQKCGKDVLLVLDVLSS